MSLRSRFIALASVGALALAGCGGSHSTLPKAPNMPVVPYNGSQQLANFTWGAGFMRQAQYVGPAQVGSLSVNVQLQMQNLPGLLQYAKMASDPSSPVYRRFLTPQEIGERFGATQASYDAAAAYFAKYHLGVGGWPQRLTMIVTGKQSDVEAAFGTKFGFYREYGRTFLAPTQQPHFSQVVPVSGVTGLVHANLERTFLIRPGNGNYFGMSGAQLRRAFDFTGAASAGFNGTGISIGIIGTGPIWSGDVPAIGRMSKIAVASVSLAPVAAQTPGPQNGNTGTAPFDPTPTGLATPPPVTAPCSQSSAGVVVLSGTTVACNQEDGEAQLDTEQVAQLAPGASVLFYLAYNNQDCAAYGFSPCDGVEGIFLTDDEIQQAIADNSADALSLSFGQDEPSAQLSGYFDASGAGVGPAEFAALAAEGIAVFVSSGDNGSHGCIDQATGGPTSQFCVEYPSSDPSVVSVGGVNYPMDGTGTLPPGAQITAWAANTTLGGDGFGDNSSGSGGGVSQFFAAPAYQSGLPATIQGTATGGKRVLPDVSMLADPLTGPTLLMYGNFPGSGTMYGASGGTSASAPEMAAAWSVVLQACKASSACATAGGAHPWRLGNPDGLFYQIYAKPAQYAATFYDVLAGSNDDSSVYPTPGPNYYPGYNAGPGYDLVTGTGVPFVGHLINAVVTGQNVP